jgi:hypothetical protein
LFALLVLLVASAVLALTAVLYLGPMLFLNSGSSFSAFTAEQLHALAYTFIGAEWLRFRHPPRFVWTLVCVNRISHIQVHLHAQGQCEATVPPSMCLQTKSV